MICTTAEVLFPSSPQHLNAQTLLKAHLRAKMTSLRLGQHVPSDTNRVFSFIPAHCPRQHPSPGGQEEPERAHSPGTLSVSVPAILPPLVCAQTHMGPRLKSFQDQEEKKSVSSAGREVAGVWITSSGLKETLLFFFPSSKRLNLVNPFHIKNLSGIHIQRGCCSGLSGELLRQQNLLNIQRRRERYSGNLPPPLLNPLSPRTGAWAPWSYGCCLLLQRQEEKDEFFLPGAGLSDAAAPTPRPSLPFPCPPARRRWEGNRSN